MVSNPKRTTRLHKLGFKPNPEILLFRFIKKNIYIFQNIFEKLQLLILIRGCRILIFRRKMAESKWGKIIFRPKTTNFSFERRRKLYDPHKIFQSTRYTVLFYTVWNQGFEYQIIFDRKCQFLYGPNNKRSWTSFFVNHIGWWFWKDKSMKVTILNVAVERGQNKNDLRPKYQKFIRL